MTGRILKHAKNNGQRWRVVSLPALAGEDDPLGRAPGEALWPEMYPRERLLQIRAGRTAYYWQSLYQQNPQAEGGMTTAGVGGPITGRGAHLLVIDDPVKNDEEARSPTCRQKQWDWWQSVASTRMLPGGLIVTIQTRWHCDDLTGRILKHAHSNGQRWRVVSLAALAGEDDPLCRAPGEALWPEMYPRDRLLRIRAGRTAYYWLTTTTRSTSRSASAG